MSLTAQTFCASDACWDLTTVCYSLEIWISLPAETRLMSISAQRLIVLWEVYLFLTKRFCML